MTFVDDHSYESVFDKLCLADANCERFFGSEMATLEICQ